VPHLAEGAFACATATAPRGWLHDGVTLPLPALDDVEGLKVPAHLPPVVDGHVHLFPEPVFDAVWRWFDQYGWPIRYKLYAAQVVDFLLSRGVSRLIALHYSHRPGLARPFNEFMAELCRTRPGVTGVATVLPGEEGARQILEDAFAAGLKGVKIHCHVQCFGPDAAEMHEVYAACVKAGLPLVMHAGREPASPAYRCDPYAICSADRVERVLKDYPALRLCVPHLGADEFDAYERLVTRYDNLWLDTTMAAAEYFPVAVPVQLIRARADRVLYGTDFPNLPYAWDRELTKLCALKLPDDDLASLLGGNARALFGLAPL
jgi:predicted TIM-barrel fold metal-dependent hydrolase